MLTKDLLRFQVRRDRVHPSFVRTDDLMALRLAEEMIAVMETATDITVGEAEEALQGFGGSHVLAPAFQKLLLDQVEEKADDGTIAERRYQQIFEAQKIRRESPIASPAEFQDRVSKKMGKEFFEIGEGLYADLPQARRIGAFHAPTPEGLLHRYNCALVQGLILRSRSLEITLGETTLAQKRRFFRMMKFHRILCEPRQTGEGLVLQLSGPLSLFDQANAYGLRLALFFPHLLHLPSWTISAQVVVKNREAEFSLDHKTGIKSHYQEQLPYIPEEFSLFVDAFNNRDESWKVTPCDELLMLGSQSYCFPDMTAVHPDGRKCHIELFHRWHGGQLADRLRALENFPLGTLRIGVSAILAKDPKLKLLLANSRWFAQNGFEFRDFPTPRTVLSLLR